MGDEPNVFRLDDQSQKTEDPRCTPNGTCSVTLKVSRAADRPRRAIAILYCRSAQRGAAAVVYSKWRRSTIDAAELTAEPERVRRDGPTFSLISPRPTAYIGPPRIARLPRSRFLRLLVPLPSGVEIASDQRFLYDTARRTRHTPDCGRLRVKKLAYHRYPTCRAWIGLRQPDQMDVVHVTYCHRLSMLLSSEDVCKRRMMEQWYLKGGISMKNLTSKAWNVEQGC